MKKFIQRLMKNKAGATAIEYGLIASLIAVAIIGATQTLGTDISNTFGDISTGLNSTSP
jgi:pilus assembly protein Flp/PilA